MSIINQIRFNHLQDDIFGGVTAKFVRDGCDKKLQIYLVGASKIMQQRLQKLGLFELIQPKPKFGDRTTVLQKTVDQVYLKRALA